MSLYGLYMLSNSRITVLHHIISNENSGCIYKGRVEI